jgi:hypothetical protein
MSACLAESEGLTLPQNGRDSRQSRKSSETPIVSPCSPSTGPISTDAQTSTTSPIRITAQLTLFPAGHPASRRPRPGSEEAARMTVGSGRNLLESLNAFYRVGSWQRILLESLVSKTEWRSRNGLLVWKLRVMHSSRRLFILLQHSAPTTADIESSLLPTLTAGEGGRQRSASKGSAIRPNLGMIAKLLPTLRAGDAKSSIYQRDHGEKGRERPTLYGIAKLLPTLTARDERTYGQARSAFQEDRNILVRVAGGTLDPVFCEWYMGFEDGWTDTESKCSVTQSHPSKRTRSSKQSRR